MTHGLSLHFLGAAGTVTGSRSLLEAGNQRVLIDCGMFQGLKNLRRRNWEPFPVECSSLSAVLLTHAHLDHSGYLPRLARLGFSGPVYASSATVDLARILLLDSAGIQEADAAFANKHQLSSHAPALPLYTIADAERVLKQFRRVEPGDWVEFLPGWRARWNSAGHILGACSIEVEHAGRRVVFSGDIGRYDDPIMIDPEPIRRADYLVLESTYGDRLHTEERPLEILHDLITRTAQRGGTVVIPAFAVGRVQLLLWYLYRLRGSGRLPANLPIYVDSPMSTDVTDIYRDNSRLLKQNYTELQAAFQMPRYVRDVQESKALDITRMPKVIISASGMATGGRVLHHLKHYAPDSRSTILFAGYQAAGTRGATMTSGAATVKIHGEYIPIRADVHHLSMLSAHADADELVRWLQGFETAPNCCFLNHGEVQTADTLRLRIKDELGWSVFIPEHLEKFSLP
ncbi:MAG TPA: MBL fold metallo-hydrolase [Burkholderiaceae bacterium]|nr:MBL fold metallo-hydrolase [Burkholderiaceae bacterium]